jgi:hypothetical protein
MTLSLLRNPPARVARAGAIFAITTLVFIAYAVPFFGPPCLPGSSLRDPQLPPLPVAPGIRRLIQDLVRLGLGGTVATGAGHLYIGALGTGGGRWDGGLDVWLAMPLCAPDSLNALLLPALAAAVTCLAGLLGAVAIRRGWMWVAAAWLAPWAHQLIFSQIPHEFFC